MDRREFLRMGVAGAALVRVRAGEWPMGTASVVALVADPSDPIASSPPARLALGVLRQRLSDAGVTVRMIQDIEDAGANDLCIIASGQHAPGAIASLKQAKLSTPNAPESLVLLATRASGRRAVLACGADARGLAYALLELGDRVRADTPTLSSLGIATAVVERPANPVRSVMRQFTSESLDKPWFYDRNGWSSYLTMLATNRFNRLHLAFGLGYDTLARVTDSYLLFLYPFLVSVPGYNVRASTLTDAERDRNLETLRFISEEAVARGVDFQLGIWMHGYQMPNSPDARYVIEGLTAETHAPYCRDALAAVLRSCPAISSVALRIHGESGVAEGSYEFWGTVFDGVPRSGRAVEIDLHAKGIDTTMIARAAATGMRINLSPKFAAEHCGMPYHQAAIRELELPVPGRTGAGLMTLSEGSRVFTRYGYADLLRDDRTYTVRPRVFAGTQRILAWGDPEWAAAYSRAFQFSGMNGADLMEPLTCRGRRGTGVGRRDGYADERLAPHHDWEKYADWYRAWGRTMYDPATPNEVFRREHGNDAGGQALASALASASRILPIVTNAHLPSAACDAYWPEVYWNQPMVAEATRNPYGDSPSPKNFQHVSALDPQLFSSVSECADELLRGERSGKYSPVDVAQWLESLASRAEADLARAGAQSSPERRRIAIDVGIQAGLGRFFAAKLRGGVLYAVDERTGDKRALLEALNAYRRARGAWAILAEKQQGVYQADLSASDKLSERGQWSDRLAGIDQDIEQMSARISAASTSSDPRVGAAITYATASAPRTTPAASHTPPTSFTPMVAVDINIAVKSALATSVRLYYRHVNQAERYEAIEMSVRDGRHHATIPAAYTNSPYPLQYYFEMKGGDGQAWLYPGFAPDLANQPYYLLRRA